MTVIDKYRIKTEEERGRLPSLTLSRAFQENSDYGLIQVGDKGNTFHCQAGATLVFTDIDISETEAYIAGTDSPRRTAESALAHFCRLNNLKCDRIGFEVR